MLIDDGVHNHYGGSYRKILMDAIHNRGIDASVLGSVRVMNWDEAYIEVCKIANER